MSAPSVAVVGGGAIGSMAAWQLATRGFAVTVYERYWPGHNEGAGGGGTRMFRRVYAEGPAYGPLLDASWRLWRRLERATNTDLLHRTGGLAIGPAHHPVLAGGIDDAERRGIPYELLDADALTDRYPQHTPLDGEIALFDPEAGVLRSNLAIRAALDAAVAHGAELRTGTTVHGVADAPGGRVEVATDTGAERHDHAVVAGGPWARALLPTLPLKTRAIFHTWHFVDDRQLLRPERFPITLRRSGPDLSYGAMSALDGTRVKLAPHADYPREVEDVDTMRRHVRTDWQRRSTALVHALLPGVSPDPVESQIYPESFTPDGHAAVGALDADARVVVLAGFSGHGFKLAPGFGRAAADLVATGASALLPPEVALDRDFRAQVSIRDLVLDSDPA
ncbi:FAD-dependent oxidoreductase [Streptomyces sp. PT12]|uniref:FAD-dependent oxidoreductase n=1 Tax=Streptomyces sp. PT12 TaxID=1510197 RepID=UPI000DE4959F|nr:FAD-dependent oxidoreductase [Streptomyces sp. PT12]RBM22984.1 sarcosine oxidase [Streptomyces sp. PT12]